MNVAHLFARSAARAGDLPALATGARVTATYAELAAQAARLAGGLRHGCGLRPGDRVALVMTNGPDYVAVMLACWWAGLAPVPVNAKLHPKEIAWILENAGAEACFVTEDHAAAVGSIAGDVRVVAIGGREHRTLAAGEPVPMAEVPGDALAWLFYTSGTTGRPKGAIITHANLRAMTCAYFADVDRIDPGDAILHAAPMSHGSGLYMLPHAAQAAVQVIPESGGFQPEEVLALLPRWPGTTLFAAPTMVQRLTGAAGRGGDTGNLKTIVYGGAPMYLADLDAAHAAFGFKLAQIYGQGESPMTITALPKAAHAGTGHPRWRERLQSVGTAQIVCELRIGDAEGNPLPTGEVGEVMVRGASVVPGYWRNPEATARTMGDGWLRTGDMGCLDAEGCLTLKDRSKDLIISGGSNVYPREVEEVLLQHAAVREVSVVGEAHPAWGEQVVACVVAEPGTTAAELDAWCLDRIARFKRPKRYVFLEALPKNAYGKVLKRELRERLASGLTPGAA